MKKVTAVLGIVLVSVVLTGCNPEGVERTPVIPDGASAYGVEVRMPSGDLVPCVVTSPGYVSCDWSKR